MNVPNYNSSGYPEGASGAGSRQRFRWAPDVRPSGPGSIPVNPPPNPMTPLKLGHAMDVSGPLKNYENTQGSITLLSKDPQERHVHTAPFGILQRVVTFNDMWVSTRLEAALENRLWAATPILHSQL